MLLLVMSMLHLCVRPAVAQGCTCNYGSVDIDSPQCVCACYPTYLQPHCLYTATDMVAIGVYVNISADTFDSYNMTSTLIWGASITASDAGTAISFTFARRTVLSSITYARYSIRGDYAQQLLWDFQAKASWQTSVGIIGVYEEVVPLGTSGNVEVDNTFVIYQSADDKIVITISTVAWALAALIFTFIIACVDNLFLHNTEAEVESIQALMDEQHQQMRIVRAQRRGVSHGEVQDYHQGGSPRQSNAKNPLDYKTPMYSDE